MTRDDLLALLTVERFGPAPRRVRLAVPSDDSAAQAERRRALLTAVALTESRRALLKEW